MAEFQMTPYEQYWRRQGGGGGAGGGGTCPLENLVPPCAPHLRFVMQNSASVTI